MQKDFHENYFQSIQILRGIAAVFIIITHIQFIGIGSFGVDIFFVISGFVILFSTNSNADSFLKKRLIRIIPLYYITTIGVYLSMIIFPSMFASTTASPIYLIKSLLFIPFDLGYGYVLPLLRVGWTLNYEMFFYLVFWLSMKMNHKYRGVICSTLLITLTFIPNLISISSIPLDFYTKPVILDFVLGMLCYYLLRYLYQNHYAFLKRQSVRIVTIFLMLLLFILLSITENSISVVGYNRPLIWGTQSAIIFILAFIVGFSEQNRRKSKLGDKLYRTFLKLGAISYSIYLVHYLPIRFFDKVVFDFSTCTLQSISGAFIAIAVCILLAFCAYDLIEKKFTNWFKISVIRDGSH